MLQERSSGLSASGDETPPQPDPRLPSLLVLQGVDCGLLASWTQLPRASDFRSAAFALLALTCADCALLIYETLKLRVLLQHWRQITFPSMMDGCLHS